MGSLFDTQVYQARRAMPWAEIDCEQLLADLSQVMLAEDEDPEYRGAAILDVVARPSVASRQWWMLSWWSESDHARHQMGAMSLSLCLWRVACREKNLRDVSERLRASGGRAKATVAEAHTQEQSGSEAEEQQGKEEEQS